MKAMILAAGRGERLRPLTDTTPKPLLQVGGETLIDRHLRLLAAAGINDVVINVSHLAKAIEAHVGTGSRHGLRVNYSHEPDGPLETAGGIAQALPLLGAQPFVAVNADVWCDFDLSGLLQAADRRTGAPAATLVVVPNPAFHPRGDFTPNGTLLERAPLNTHTFAGLGVYEPVLFEPWRGRAGALAPLLFRLAGEHRLGGLIHPGRWFDIGTPARLADANAALEPGSAADA